MKVLHINLVDCHGNGGTGLVMYRLHRELIDRGYADSSILALHKNELEEGASHAIPRSRPIRVGERMLRPLTDRLGLYELNVVSTFGITRLPEFLEADVLHLHCIHEGYFNYLALPCLARKKPVVFTLHDLWGVTGGCHHPFECDGFTRGCQDCPRLPYVRGPQVDGAGLQLRLKQWAYRHCGAGLSFACPSRWVADSVHRSTFREYPIYHVPNGINTDAFRPLDKRASRARFDVPTDARVLMFGCEHLQHWPKGMDLLVRALKSLPDAVKRDTQLLLVGHKREGSQVAEEVLRETGMRACGTGYLDSDGMAAAYSAADLFLFPTRAETFGLMGLESLSCGTPVVAFRVGGVPDYVRHGETGYLAQPEDPADFALGVLSLLTDHKARERMSVTGRRVAVEEFSIGRMAHGYADLYDRMLAEARVSHPTAANGATPNHCTAPAAHTNP